MSPLGAIAALHAGVAAGFTLVCAVALARFAPKHARRLPAVERPRVVLFRPAERVDERLRARLDEDPAAYSGELVRVVCVPSLADGGAALPAGVTLAASLLADDDAVNRKARHLAAGEALARARGWLDAGAVAVHADADVVLGEGDLDALVDELLAGGPRDAAFAAPAPEGGTPVAAWLASAIVGASPQAFAVVWALACLTRGAPALAGKLVALREDTLAALGGYARLASSIADDLALVAALREIGAGVALSARAVRTRDAGRTSAAVLAQMTRWMRVVGAHRPALLVTYPLLVAPLGVALVLGALGAIAGDAAVVLVALVTLVAARTLLAATLARGPYRGRLVAPWLAPMGAIAADVTLLAALVRASAKGPIEWSGRRYTVARGGRIVAAEPVRRST